MALMAPTATDSTSPENPPNRGRTGTNDQNRAPERVRFNPLRSACNWMTRLIRKARQTDNNMILEGEGSEVPRLQPRPVLEARQTEQAKESITRTRMSQHFIPSLGDDPTRIILTFTMYDREARRTLTGDLAYLYREDMFRKKPGIDVTGAGTAEVNGFYRRREASQGAPKSLERPGHDWEHNNWVEITGGRPFYEKDDGTYIFWYATYKEWTIRFSGCAPFYSAATNSVLPPATGWRPGHYRGVAPPPTLS